MPRSAVGMLETQESQRCEFQSLSPSLKAGSKKNPTSQLEDVQAERANSASLPFVLVRPSVMRLAHSGETYLLRGVY